MAKRVRLTAHQYNDLLNSINKEEFFNYYLIHSNKQVCVYFNISSLNVLSRLCKDLKIVLSDDQKRQRNKFATIEGVREKYGVDNVYQLESIKEKIQNTNLQLFGVKNVFQSEEIKTKIKQTKLERHGNENFSNIEKTQNTCLERYGVKNVFQSEEIKAKYKLTSIEKYGYDNCTKSPKWQEQQCLKNIEKYGVPHTFQRPDVREKCKQTMLDRYGVEYACLIDNCRKSFKNDSSINRLFEDLFINVGLVIDKREFVLDRYSYDFKIGKYLIEINPSITHNSSFSIWDNVQPKDKYYHQNKSIVALNNGYRCIHIWDWNTENDLIDIINGIYYNYIPINVRFTEPRQWVYDLKKHELHYDNFEDNCVIVYDDGVDLNYT